MPKRPRHPYTDVTLMPWGEHMGVAIGDVDSSYLLWLFRQPWIREWPDLHDYLVANQTAFLQESEEEEQESQGEFTSFEDYMRYGRH